jgi:ferric-dicitrate binding protein FerR (iron transport regulator)
MLLTHLAVDRSVLDGLHAGDSASLEHLFRAHFAQMVTEATIEPSDAAYAPHVVERAFVRLWADRRTLDTPEAVEAFLHNAIHEAVVRERSRRAAIHRLEENVHARVAGGSTSVSVDDAWARVAAAVRPPAPPTAESSIERVAHARHAAAEHLASVTAPRKLFDWRMFVGSIVLIGAIIGLLSWMARGAANDVVDGAIAAPDSRLITTRPAQRAATALRDGSRAALGADSRLRVPQPFGRGMRALGLEGTATFTAASGQSDPLHVRAGGVSITSAGGVFSVRSYPGDPVTAVAAREGEVTVTANGESRVLAPGSALAVARDGAMTPLVAPALDDALGWADGRLVLTRRPLREALPEFKRWYLLDLYAQDSALAGREITMSSDLASSRQAIAALETAGELKLVYQGKTMVLQDARPRASGARR